LSLSAGEYFCILADTGAHSECNVALGSCPSRFRLEMARQMEPLRITFT